MAKSLLGASHLFSLQWTDQGCKDQGPRFQRALQYREPWKPLLIGDEDDNYIPKTDNRSKATKNYKIHGKPPHCDKCQNRWQTIEKETIDEKWENQLKKAENDWKRKNGLKTIGNDKINRKRPKTIENDIYFGIPESVQRLIAQLRFVKCQPCVEALLSVQAALGTMVPSLVIQHQLQVLSRTLKAVSD